MRRLALLLLGGAVVVLAGSILAQPSALPRGEYETVERGRQVAVAADCAGCHTAPGGRPFAGGLEMRTPFGMLVTPNITPDVQTGMGRYSFSDFRVMLRSGIGRGGKRLYPAMPYPAYSGMTDTDIAALYTYLQTLPAVRQHIEVNQLPFPFNVRSLMTGWNALNFRSGKALTPDPRQSAEWNRGRYLTDVLGHCGGCHTPKNALGGDRSNSYLQSGLLEGWVAPDLTGNVRKGLGRWSTPDIVTYLRTGQNRHSFASGPMATVVEYSTSRMSDDDLQSIAIYLKSVGSSNEPPSVPIPADDLRMRAGRDVYIDRCSACHNRKGDGQNRIFPSLAHNAMVNQDNPTSVISMILFGTASASPGHNSAPAAMPGFARTLTNWEVASVTTYIRNSWGNVASEGKARQVADVRSNADH